MRNLADARLVCEARQTVAELQRQFVEWVDASNLADTLRIAPWTAHAVRQPVGAYLVRTALAQARQQASLTGDLQAVLSRFLRWAD